MTFQRISQALMLIAAMAVLPDAARGENWPRFRGPNGAGHAAGPFTVPLTEADIAWKQALPGVGHSSPIVWGEQLYVTAADADQLQRYVVCLSTETGKELWRHSAKFIQHRKHRDNSFASSTPAADDLGVYAIFTTPQEYTITALGHDGKVRWTKSLGRFESNHGSGASPMVYGELLIINHDQEAGESALRAFDRKTGNLVWSLEGKTTGKAAMSTPTIWKPASSAATPIAVPEQLVYTTFGGGIAGVDPKTGKRLWAASDVFFSRPIGSPQTTGEIVIGVCGEGTGNRALIAVRPDPTGAKPPEVAYKIEQLGPHVPCPLIAGANLVLLNDLGQLTVVDVATGKTKWSQKVANGFYASPVLVGDVIWAASKTGDLYGIQISDTGGKEICKLPLGGQCHSTVAIANGRMFVRTTGTVVCIKK